MGLESGTDIYDASDPEFIYKYSPIFALAVSVIRQFAITPAASLVVWYSMLFVCLGISMYAARQILSATPSSLSLDTLQIIPALFIFRYLVLANFISYIPSEWPLYVRIFDICLYALGSAFMLSLFFSYNDVVEKKYLLAVSLSLLINLRFVLLNIDRAQANLVILALVLMFVYYTLKGKDFLAGLYLGTGMVCKLVPAIFILYLILKKRWKAVYSAVATFMTLLILPSAKWGMARNNELLMGWLNSLRITFREEYLNYKNQSLFSMISRLFSRDSQVAIAGLDQEYVTCIVAASYIFFLSILIYTVAKRNKTGKEAAAVLPDICLFMVAMTFLSPVGTMHTFIYMILPIALVIKYALDIGLKDKVLNVIIIVYAAAAYLNSPDIIGKYSVFISEYSFMTLVLFIILFVIIYIKKKYRLFEHRILTNI